MDLSEIKTLIELGNTELGTFITRQGEFNERFVRMEAVVNRLVKAAQAGPPTAGVGGGGTRAVFPSLAEFKAMRIGDESAGGAIVSGASSGPFFEALGAQAVVLAANPVVVNMEKDEQPLPRELDSSDPAPVGEGGLISETDMVLGKAMLRARKYPIRTRASNELLEDSNPSARELVADFHVRKLARRIDRDMLEGNGGNAGIIGIRRTVGASGDELGSGDGASPVLDDILDGLGRLEDADVDMGRVVIFMAGRTWKVLRKEKDQIGGRYQVQPNVGEEARKVLFGRPVFTTSQITVSETVGNSSDCSWIGLCDMSRIAVGRRLELRVLYDPYTRSQYDETVVQSLTRQAFVVVDPAAVDLITGVRG